MKEKITSAIKTKTLFDHISHIREVKDPNYYRNLSEQDKKTFNKYVILMGLSMDVTALPNLAYLSKYFDILSNEAFYKVCCDLTPLGKKFSKWIKSSAAKYNKQLIEIVTNHYKISKDEAYEYCTIYFHNEANLQQLAILCEKYGYSEKEVEKLLSDKYE
jgi:hypothetical protein